MILTILLNVYAVGVLFIILMYLVTWEDGDRFGFYDALNIMFWPIVLVWHIGSWINYKSKK